MPDGSSIPCRCVSSSALIIHLASCFLRWTSLGCKCNNLFEKYLGWEHLACDIKHVVYEFLAFPKETTGYSRSGDYEEYPLIQMLLRGMSCFYLGNRRKERLFIVISLPSRYLGAAGWRQDSSKWVSLHLFFQNYHKLKNCVRLSKKFDSLLMGEKS